MSIASSQPSQPLEPLLFNNLASRQVVTDFSAGHLSTDGGILLLRQIDEGLGISRKLAGCFHDQRNPLFIEHSLREIPRPSSIWRNNNIPPSVLRCPAEKSLTTWREARLLNKRGSSRWEG